MNHFPPIATLLVALVAMSGCAPAQQWLQPRVCDCESTQSCQATPDDITRALAGQHIDHAHYRALVDGEHAAEALARQAAEEERASAVRSPEELAQEPIDPHLADSVLAVDDDQERQAFEERHDIEFPSETRAYRGSFDSRDRTSVAIHRPGEALEFYEDGSLIASLNLQNYDTEFAPTEISSFRSGAVDLLRDGRAQLQLVHRHTDEDGETTFYVSVYKLIGGHVGTILRRPFARTTITDGDEEVAEDAMEHLADIRFLHGIDQRIIEWIPLDKEGQPASEPLHLEWNKWEGVYRVPKPPPTAPQQPQS